MKITLKEIAEKQFKHLSKTLPLPALLGMRSLGEELLNGLTAACGEITNMVETLHADQSHAEGDIHVVSPDSAFATQVGGNHYQMPIQHAEFCQKNKLPWCESAAIKYLVRHKRKNGIQDLRKAVHYIELAAQIEYDVAPSKLHEKA